MEQMVRGNIALSTVSYIEKAFPAADSARITAGLSKELAGAIPKMKRTDWVPRAYWTELLRAIVSVHDEPKRSYDDLVACGRSIAADSTNTFMRLLLKMLTPGLFARKFPDFWQRDHRGGYAEVNTTDLDRNRFVMFIKDVAGFEHIGPVGVGFVGFAMDTITGKSVSISQSGWSYEAPAPAECRYEVSW